MIPVPGYGVGTPYGRRGPYWSCDRDAAGNGIHTGVDYPAPVGARVVAARPGTAVYSSHGSAFGYHQLDIRCGDGTRDFYAHMPSRAVADGARVEAGQTVGKVGSEGNVTGPHLHFERHATETGGWSCAVVRDPAPSINYASSAGSGGSGSSAGQDEEMPKFSRTRMTKTLTVKPNVWTNLVWDAVSGGDAGTAGQAYILIGPSAYTGTLLATVEAGGEVIRTRFIERAKQGSDWVTNDSYPNVEHPLTSGKTYIADTRTQNVPKDTRLVCQVNIPNGGTIESAEFSALYF